MRKKSASFTSSNEWVVTHNFDTEHVVTDAWIQFGSGIQKVDPADVQIVDANSIKIVFSSSRTGGVTVVADGEGSLLP